MKLLRLAGRVAYHLLAAIGLAVVLMVFTPFVSWWAQAYSGPLAQPKGEVLILLAAAADDRGGISFSSYWRAREAVYAWQTGGFQKIVISGGGGPGIYNFLVAEGVPAKRSLRSGVPNPHARMPKRQRISSRAFRAEGFC